MSTRNRIKEAIERSVKKTKAQQKEYLLFGRIIVYVNGELTQGVSMDDTIKRVEETIPAHLMDEIDSIFIGYFEENEERALEAHYDSGAIYISNMLDRDFDFLENIIHEASHAVEKQHGLQIYGDRKIEIEFAGKRKRLKSILKNEGFSVDAYDFMNTEYNETFDNFLHKEVGYSKLGSAVMGLFVSPYAATSLEEYWAVGFEDYFVGDREYLKKISPQLFNKIKEIKDDIE
tara:strand:+ start:334 stop:1029 length:696 start_codon:yes stop_codon:yes gene_type:complete